MQFTPTHAVLRPCFAAALLQRIGDQLYMEDDRRHGLTPSYELKDGEVLRNGKPSDEKLICLRPRKVDVLPECLDTEYHLEHVEEDMCSAIYQTTINLFDEGGSGVGASVVAEGWISCGWDEDGKWFCRDTHEADTGRVRVLNPGEEGKQILLGTDDLDPVTLSPSMWPPLQELQSNLSLAYEQHQAHLESRSEGLFRGIYVSALEARQAARKVLVKELSEALKSYQPPNVLPPSWATIHAELIESSVERIRIGNWRGAGPCIVCDEGYVPRPKKEDVIGMIDRLKEQLAEDILRELDES